MRIESLHELYLEQLQDLYDAENQIIIALPKMIDACTSDELRDALEEHLEITKQQATRLEKIFNNLGDMAPDVKDAAIIAAAQRVEHYEMAVYGTARTYATLLNDSDSAALLEQTLEEEKEADRTLSEIAEQVNAEAEVQNEEARQSQTVEASEKKAKIPARKRVA